MKHQNIFEWEEVNIPKQNLHWKEGQSEQIKELLKIGSKFNILPTVVGDHCSKSVSLPVSCFSIETSKGNVKLFIRDNFYDIKCSIISEFKIKNFSLAFFYPEISQNELEKEIERYCEYYGKEKPIDDSWYEDWSSSSILREKNRIFIAKSVNSCYCEGINNLGFSKNVFTHYKEGTTEFTVSFLSYSSIEHLIEALIQIGK